MLALLDALKGAVEDFAAREEKLNHDFQTRSAAELNAFESAKLEQQSKQADALAAAEAALAEEKNRRNARFEKRKVRINRAHSVAEPAGAGRRQRAGREHSNKKSGKTRPRRNAGGMSNWPMPPRLLRVSSKNWTRAIEAFARLEKSARRAFRGYGKFRRLLGLPQIMAGTRPFAG